MNEPNLSLLASDTPASQRRVTLAQQAFKEFFAQCFWSYDPDLVVTDRHIPFIIRELRLNGGHKGYRIAAELCR